MLKQLGGLNDAYNRYTVKTYRGNPNVMTGGFNQSENFSLNLHQFPKDRVKIKNV